MKTIVTIIIMLMLAGFVSAETEIKNEFLNTKSIAVFLWLELDSKHQKEFKEKHKNVDEYTDIFIKIDGVEKKFTYDEFKMLLGFTPPETSGFYISPYGTTSNLLVYEGEKKQ
jgi:hypothetical protein